MTKMIIKVAWCWYIKLSLGVVVLNVICFCCGFFRAHTITGQQGRWKGHSHSYLPFHWLYCVSQFTCNLRYKSILFSRTLAFCSVGRFQPQNLAKVLHKLVRSFSELDSKVNTLCNFSSFRIVKFLLTSINWKNLQKKVSSEIFRTYCHKIYWYDETQNRLTLLSCKLFWFYFIFLSQKFCKITQTRAKQVVFNEIRKFWKNVEKN